MRRLQPFTERFLIVRILLLVLFDLAFRLCVTQLCPSSLGQLSPPIPDYVIFVGDLRNCAQDHRDHDEDRPEEDELVGRERRDGPDDCRDSDRTRDQSDQRPTDPVLVVPFGGGIDLFGGDRDAISLQPGQSLGPRWAVEFLRFEVPRLGDDEVLNQVRNFTKRLHPPGGLDPLVELLRVDLAQGIGL